MRQRQTDRRNNGDRYYVYISPGCIQYFNSRSEAQDFITDMDDNSLEINEVD